MKNQKLPSNLVRLRQGMIMLITDEIQTKKFGHM